MSATGTSPEKTPVATVTLTIDGRVVTVPEGTLVIRAAEDLGIEIPRFCDHPLLAPAGACRQCLVDIPDAGNGRGFPKPQASCTIPVAEGMVVETANPVAAKAQAGVMEFLLINHPLDCPVCDKGGECPLQDQAMSAGRTDSRFAASGGVKRTFPKPIPLSANILLDRERCVLCQRCTRFADEIAGDPGISLVERGARQQIGLAPAERGASSPAPAEPVASSPTPAEPGASTAPGIPFSSYFSGNIIQICPVGALTSTEYRFRSRPFDLVSVTGVGEHDACGAALRTDRRRGRVLRRMAERDDAVNQEWLSDKDRFGFAYLRDRISTPLIREDGVLREASWTEAFAVAGAGLSGRSAALLPGGRLTLEDARAWAAFGREVLGTADMDFRARPVSAEETRFLAEHVAGRAVEVTYADLAAAPLVVLVGLEPEDEAATIFLRLRAAVTAGQTRVITLAPYTSLGSAKLGAEVIPVRPGEEAAALAALDLPAGAIVLAGERLALSPGALAAVVGLSAGGNAETPVRWAWVPRRAGDRGAVEAGLLPGPGGRDTEAILAAAREGRLGALVMGGVSLDDLADPDGARAALAAVPFVVSLEQRRSEVAEYADVVLPVAAVAEKSGTFLTWEGRERSFGPALESHALSDARVLAGLAAELPARPADLALPAPSAGSTGRIASEPGPSDTSPSAGTYALATWKLHLDQGVMQRGDADLAATARPAVVRLSAATVHSRGLSGGALVTVTGDRGSVTLPVEVADLLDDVVWVPANSFGRGVLADLASPRSRVELAAVQIEQEKERP